MSGRARKSRRSRSIRQLAESKLAGGAAVDLEKLTPDEIRGFVPVVSDTFDADRS
jgi:hypothetical protein